MKKSLLIKIGILHIILYAFNIFGLEGIDIIKRANKYKEHVWYCNDWNARTSNADKKYKNNDLRYPFYPEGALYKDEEGNIVISNGWNTGVAYAWGLREKIEIYEKKLKEKKIDGSGYLAGNHETKNKKNKIGRRKKWERLR